MSEFVFISEKFSKLFIQCKDRETFVLPTFEKSTDIEALVVLNQIVKIAAMYHTNPTNVSNIIALETLQNIVNIKCTEFCNSPITESPKTQFGTFPPQGIFGTTNYGYQNSFHSSSDQKKGNVESFKTSFYNVVNDMVESFVKRTQM